MKADLKGALEQINRSWRVFEHKGQPMTKQEVKAVLEYGIKQGYEDMQVDGLSYWQKVQNDLSKLH